MPAKTVVVIPTYNERETIAPLIRAVLGQQQHLADFALTVLVVDSQSRDGTVESVRQLSEEAPVQLLELQERGLGLALARAQEWAVERLGADVIVQMDADFSHDPGSLPSILSDIAQGYDLVLGSRYIKGGGIQEWPLNRRILSRGANLVIRLLTGKWQVHDWTSGYRALSASLYKRLDRSAIAWDDYTLQPALVYEAICKGGKVKEVPIRFVNRQRGESKLPAVGYSVNILRHFLVASLKQRLGSSRRAA